MFVSGMICGSLMMCIVVLALLKLEGEHDER